MQSKITLRKIYTAFFFVGIFFIPFNDFEGLSFLGEYKNEAATYFFLIGFLILIIESLLKGKINIPYRNSLSIVLILFIVWTFLSTLINIEAVLDNYYKQTSGINRYIRQTISLLISAVIFTIFFWNVIRNYRLDKIFLLIRKTLLFSLIFVSVYGSIEIAIVHFGMRSLEPIYKAFEIFPFLNSNFEGGKRVSSVAYEVPALGNYLITVGPWMLSYILTEKRWYKFIPSLCVLVLMYFSDSRTAMICILIELLLFIVLLLYDIRYRKTTVKALQIVTASVLLLLVVKSNDIIEIIDERADRLNFYKNLTENVSNKTRFGMQYASFQVFKENPIVGVGLGQDTYHKIYHYPYWSTHNNWEFDLYYTNLQVKSFPSGYNIYTRLLSELGIVGIFLFLTFIFLCIYYSILFWKYADNRDKYMGVILILSFVGLSVNWMQTDFFRQYGIWLCLALIIRIRMIHRAENEKKIKLA